MIISRDAAFCGISAVGGRLIKLLFSDSVAAINTLQPVSALDL